MAGLDPDVAARLDELEGALLRLYEGRVRKWRKDVEAGIERGIDPEAVMARMRDLVDAVAAAAPEVRPPPSAGDGGALRLPAAPAEGTAPAPDPYEGVLAAVAALPARLSAAGISLPDLFLAFVPQTEAVLRRIPSDERAGERGFQFLVGLMDRLDRLRLLTLHHPRKDDVEAAVEEFAVSIGSLLQGSHRVLLVPGSAADLSACGEETVTFPASAAPGTLVAVERRGLVDSAGNALRPARAVRSAVTPGAVAAALASALRSVHEAGLAGRIGPLTWADLVERFTGWLGESADPDIEKQRTIGRYAVNLVYRHAAEHALSRALHRLGEALESLGIFDIRVEAGARFDASFDASRFERKTVRSGGKSGTIIRVAQPGFRTREGVTVQKAVLEVEGEP